LTMQPESDVQTNGRKREEHLSSDGQRRSFPKVPHLLQCVSNGNRFGRIKVGGKVIRESLKTTVWTTAKLRLTDFLKGRQESRGRVTPPRFSEAVALFERELEGDTTIKPRSKEYRRLCLKKIRTSWPLLWNLRLDGITAQACKEWAAELSKGIATRTGKQNCVGAQIRTGQKQGSGCRCFGMRRRSVIVLGNELQHLLASGSTGDKQEPWPHEGQS